MSIVWDGEFIFSLSVCAETTLQMSIVWAERWANTAIANEKQRYKCPSCGFQFTHRTPRGYPPWLRALSVFLYCHGLSMNAIAKMFSVSPTTILRWIRQFGIQHAQPPEPETDTAGGL